MTPMTVLVVEDDESLRRLIVATLPDDWTPVEAGDGMEAIALARQHHPDAVILDHDLPMLAGADVCEVLRRETWSSHTCIVALTGSDDRHVRRRFADAGADAFLLKPFSPVQLLDLLDRWESLRV
ncbi:MAG: response regulator [Actinobacteria bacterium]|nr:response regulator [Actinomycetota bacterium]